MNYVVKLNIEDLRPNMILAEDMVTSMGTVVLGKNTRLNNINFDKITAYDIPYAMIFSDSIDESVTTFIESNKASVEAEKAKLTELNNLILNESQIQVEKAQEYKEFAQNYDNSISDVSSKFQELGTANSIPVNDLFELTNEIIGSVKNKSDVFYYLRNLKIIDDYTYPHCINVSILCNMFGKWLGLNDKSLKELTIAGILHDIGKVDIESTILNKNSKLTPEEYELVKKHSTYGYEKVLNNPNISSRMKTAILMHHERMDGTGYPLQVSGENIEEFARIIGICDVYDAMISGRPYRVKFCPFDVIEKFDHDYYTLFDTKLLFIFLENIAYTYVGSKAMLSDARPCEIVFINNAYRSRPIVKVGEEFIDLSKKSELKIVKVF